MMLTTMKNTQRPYEFIILSYIYQFMTFILKIKYAEINKVL